jgi:hypothetical protein
MITGMYTAGLRPLRGGTSFATDELENLLSSHRETIAELAIAPRTADRISKVTATDDYAELMRELRSIAVRHRADPKAPGPKLILEGAADAMNVPVLNLEALAKVAEDKVSKWRPAIINADLVQPDEVSKTSDTSFQHALDKLSSVLPKPKSVEVPMLGELYRAIGVLLPMVDDLGRLVSEPLDAASKGVRGWSDALADDVQAKLRDLRAGIAPSGLGAKDLAKLPETTQRMVLMASESLTGMALDTELFVRWARDPKSVRVDDAFRARISRFASSGLFGLAGLLGSLSSGIEGLTSEKGWRSFAVHLTGGGNLEKWTVTMARPGITIMFPSLEQVERNDGRAQIQLYFRFCPVDSMYGGVSLNPRGTSIKARTGPVGASVSDYGHTVRLGIPGMYGFNFGEDYAYGASASVGYSPVVAKLGAVKVRAGGKVDVFHPSPVALGALAGGAAILGAMMGGINVPPEAWVAVPAIGSVVVGTLFPYARQLARGISLGCDAVYRPIARWFHRAAHALGLAKTEPKNEENGWPVGQRWSLLLSSVERGEAALALAQDRLQKLKTIDPERMIDAVGAERAFDLLRGNAERPAEVHRTMVEYLEAMIAKLREETELVRAGAKDRIDGKNVDMSRVKGAAQKIDGEAIAFEFVDALLDPMLAPLSAESVGIQSRSTQPPVNLRPVTPILLSE